MWPRTGCCSRQQVLLTNGVDEAIHVLCQAFLDRGDAMLLPVPTYIMYEVYGSAAEAQIDAVPAGRRLSFSARAMLPRFTRARG